MKALACLVTFPLIFSALGAAPRASARAGQDRTSDAARAPDEETIEVTLDITGMT